MLVLVKTFLTHFTYLALFVVLIAAGIGVPIPEDVPLAFSGYLCHVTESPLVDADNDGSPDLPSKVPYLWGMIVAGMLGVLTGDSFVFYVGRTGLNGNNFVVRHLRKVLTDRRREKVARHFEKHGNLTVFFGRFMPGLRSPIFGMAGLAKMSYLRFILIDGIAAAISVPTFILLGHHFAYNLNKLWEYFDHVKYIALPVFIGLCAIVLCIYLSRRSRRIAAEKAAASHNSPPTVPPASNS